MRAFHTPDVPVTFGLAREQSPAITEDASMLVNRHAKKQQQPNPAVAAQQDVGFRGVLVKPQAASTRFEDHLRHAETAFKKHETEAVKAFLSSVREEYRIPLGDKLEGRGEWTWQAAKEEGKRIVEAESKTQRRSARLMIGTSRPS